jgi:hypothetical protein
MCWLRHRPPVPIVSWWGSLQWVNPLQPSVRSAGQSFFSLLLCCYSSSGCNMGLLWFPSLSWWFILFSWMTFRSSCRVWLVTYQGAFEQYIWKWFWKALLCEIKLLLVYDRYINSNGISLFKYIFCVLKKKTMQTSLTN